MPIPSVALIAFIIGIALLFDFTNGFHDSANSISTVVSTRVLSPKSAVAFAAFFNFIAAFWAMRFFKTGRETGGLKKGSGVRRPAQVCRITMSEMIFATVSYASVASSSSCTRP